MSPGWLAPISTTASCVSEVMRSRVKGTPMLLFRLPSVAVTRYLTDSTSRISSFVVVLPFVPVKAMTVNGFPSTIVIDLCQRASSCKVFKVSSTFTRRGSSEAATAADLLTTAYLAPSSSAFSAYSLPSKFSPFRAKNISPPLSVRVSVVTTPHSLNLLYIDIISINIDSSTHFVRSE